MQWSFHGFNAVGGELGAAPKGSRIYSAPYGCPSEPHMDADGTTPTKTQWHHPFPVSMARSIQLSYELQKKLEEHDPRSLDYRLAPPGMHGEGRLPERDDLSRWTYVVLQVASKRDRLQPYGPPRHILVWSHQALQRLLMA